MYVSEGVSKMIYEFGQGRGTELKLRKQHRIVAECQAKHYTQDYIANKVGCSQAYVSQVFNDKIVMTLDMMFKWLSALQLDTDV